MARLLLQLMSGILVFLPQLIVANSEDWYNFYIKQNEKKIKIGYGYAKIENEKDKKRMHILSEINMLIQGNTYSKIQEKEDYLDYKYRLLYSRQQSFLPNNLYKIDAVVKKDSLFVKMILNGKEDKKEIDRKSNIHESDFLIGHFLESIEKLKDKARGRFYAIAKDGDSVGMVEKRFEVNKTIINGESVFVVRLKTENKEEDELLYINKNKKVVGFEATKESLTIIAEITTKENALKLEEQETVLKDNNIKISEDECIAFGEMLENSFIEDDSDFFKKRLSISSVVNSMSKDQGISFVQKEAFKMVLLPPLQSIADQININIKQGGSYQFIKYLEQDKPCLLFRLLAPNGGLNYHEIYLGIENNEIKINDLLAYVNAGTMAEILTPFAIAASIEQKSNPTIDEQEFMNNFRYYEKVIANHKNRNFPEMFLTYEKLSPELKNKKYILIRVIQALDKTKSIEASRQYQRLYPDDYIVYLSLIDLYATTNQLDALFICLDKLYEFTQDPYLKYYYALLEMQALPGREDILLKGVQKITEAIKEEVRLPDPYWYLMGIHIGLGNFQQAVDVLALLQQNFEISAQEIHAVLEQQDLDSFLQRPEYTKWLEENN